MNVTQAHIYFRSDTNANLTSANTPLGNASLNAGEAVFVTDQKRVRVGIGNYTTLDSLANLTDISTLNTTVSGKSDIGHVHVIANVTGLQTALDGKSATTHVHDAANITTGTIATARLGSGTANSSTYLRGDQTWATVSGGGGSGTDRGFWYDIRDYGAELGSANDAANTDAVQDAVDAAAVQSGGWGGGTVYFPATENQDTSVWDLRTPVWVHGSNIKIQGEGSQNTLIRAKGPAFIVSKHPRFWDLWKSTYASDASATTGTVDGATNWIGVSKCKPDLHEFRAAGTFPPTNGNPAFAPARVAELGAGTWFGIRTQKGVAQARYPYCPLATGDKTQTNQSANLWPHHSKITWEFVTYHHEANMCGAIAGCGGIAGSGAPDPWSLYGAAGEYYFELALTDKDMIDRTWVRWKCAMNDTVGIHRICVQFDPDNADSSKRFAMFVDGVQKATTFVNIQWFHRGNYVPLNTVDGSGTADLNLWTRFNRVARWVESDFTVGCESSKTAFYYSEQAATLTDYSVLAVAVHTDALYQVNGATTSQTKIAGGAADDSTVFPYASGGTFSARTESLGWMANEFSWSPNADTNLNINLMVRGVGGKEVWGYLCPKGNANNWEGTPQAVDAPTIEGLRIRQYNAYPVSCGILNGPWINCYRLNDLEFDQGYYASIGAMWDRVSYYGRWTNLKLGKMVHLIHQTVEGERWDWGYSNVCAIRICGSEFRLKNFSHPAPEANDEGFLASFMGGSIGAGIVIEDGTINQEGLTFAPSIAVFYVEKNYAHGNNSLTIRNVQVGEVAAPILILNDFYYDYTIGTSIDIKGMGFAAFGSTCIVRGKDWHGEIEMDPSAYMTEQVKYLDALAGSNFCDMKTIDTSGYGLPMTGGFTHDAHEIHPRNPPQGGVAIWRPTKATNAISYEGSNDPPSWQPMRFVDSARMHAMSANIHPGFNATCSLPWPSGGSPTTLAFTSLTNSFAKAALSTILAGATAPSRSHLTLKWGYTNLYPLSTGRYDAEFFASGEVANSGNWASAASGSMATTAAINTTGILVPAWSIFIRRPWCWALELGDGTGDLTTGQKLAFVGRTNVKEPVDWVVDTGDTPQVASGGLTLRRTTRAEGNWCHYSSNRILEWIRGASLSLGSTWHFGLSTTPVSTTAGTGMTEPAGGSYAREPVTMNGTNWGELFDSSYIFANKTAIEFDAPTGNWGRITHWFISDASSGGNIIAAGPLNRPIFVQSGDAAPVFLPGAFQIQL